MSAFGVGIDKSGLGIGVVDEGFVAEFACGVLIVRVVSVVAFAGVLVAGVLMRDGLAVEAGGGSFLVVGLLGSELFEVRSSSLSSSSS